jgi:hypothetical protein
MVEEGCLLYSNLVVTLACGHTRAACDNCDFVRKWRDGRSYVGETWCWECSQWSPPMRIAVRVEPRKG